MVKEKEALLSGGNMPLCLGEVFHNICQHPFDSDKNTVL